MQEVRIVSVAANETIPADLQTEAKGVSLRDVTKRYGAFTAVQSITLDIPAGSYTCLLGPIGCGKTTTMRMIAVHEDISSGDIYIIVGLSSFSDRKPTMLSGGQQQRVALARALVTRPQVLMLEAPLSALDENLRVDSRET